MKTIISIKCISTELLKISLSKLVGFLLNMNAAINITVHFVIIDGAC